MKIPIRSCFGSIQNDAGDAEPVVASHRVGQTVQRRLVLDREAEAEAPAGAQEARAVVVEVIGGHERDRRRAQDALSVQLAAVEEHLREARVVLRGGHESTATREAVTEVVKPPVSPTSRVTGPPRPPPWP